jgi:uncharacterized membrane protein
VDVAIEKAKAWVLGGNPVTRIGLIVLFCGVSFLLKYAAARNMLPIELRLAAVLAAGIALVVVGWRLRANNRTYALLLQGGGIGVVYLSLFAAAKLYHLLPLTLCLILMLALVGFSAALAILQNALPLAQFGTMGGFLAPVLMSTGSGSHVMLFSYYALLNAGVFAIAWFRAWRSLNLTGSPSPSASAVCGGPPPTRPSTSPPPSPFWCFSLFFTWGSPSSTPCASRRVSRV